MDEYHAEQELGRKALNAEMLAQHTAQARVEAEVAELRAKDAHEHSLRARADAEKLIRDKAAEEQAIQDNAIREQKAALESVQARLMKCEQD